MYTGSEDGAIKIWDLRAPSCQRNYDVGSAVNTVALHPNQAELISGDMDGKVKVGHVKAGLCRDECVAKPRPAGLEKPALATSTERLPIINRAF